MAYDAKNLSALTYANGFTLWHYKTTDAAATVDTSGYFNDAAGMMRVNDFILAACSTGGSVESGVLVVKTNTGTVVDVANLSTFGPINSD